MKLKVMAMLAAGLLSAALAGCSLRDASPAWLSTEGRINAAFPLAQAVGNNQAWLLEALTGAQKKEFESQLKSRLQLRALNCAKGYAPSIFASSEAIRKKLGGPSCFVEADKELVKWTGLLRAGVVLARPPLKPVPKTIPAFVAAQGFISGAHFAQDAPFALFDVGPGQSIELVDMETSRSVFREPAGSGKIGQLSPNGRLFTTGDAGRTSIRESETGETLVELPYVGNFQWLDARTAVGNKKGSDRESAYLIDFVSGREVPITQLGTTVQRAVAVRGVDDQFVVLTHRGATKIRLDRTALEPGVTLLGDKQLSPTSWASNTSGATSDGAHFFGSWGPLQIVNMASLEVDTVAFEPFFVQLPYPTPDPDKIAIRGFVNPSRGEGTRAFLYSISKRTLLPIEVSKLPSDRFVYIPSLRRQGVINDRRIEVLGDLPTLEEIPLAKFAGDMQELSNQRKMEAFEKQQQLGQQSAALHAVGKGLPVVPGVAVPNAPLFEASRDAQVEAVGVYQGAPVSSSQSPGARRSGIVEVRIRRSTKPIVLVLSSYESVRWMLVTESGARLAAVVVSGYHPSNVVGAGSTRVLTNGGTYAYKQDSPQYQALNRDVAKLTGKAIGVFQGRYEGSQFSVGGF